MIVRCCLGLFSSVNGLKIVYVRDKSWKKLAFHVCIEFEQKYENFKPA